MIALRLAAVARRSALLSLLLGFVGLGCRSAPLDELEVASRAGIACGAQVCRGERIFCVFCPADLGSRPVCGAQPANFPDYWTPGTLCDPSWPPGRSLPVLTCDGAEDCPAGRACAMDPKSVRVFCSNPIAVCAGPYRPLCRSRSDCPACAVDCRPHPTLPVRLCEW